MLVAGFLIGVAYGPVGPLVNLALQTRSPEHMRGRVVGIITSAEYAAGPFGYLIVGLATERFGVQPTFLAIAAVIMIVALASLGVRALRQLDDLPDRLPDAPEVAPGDAAARLEAALDVATSGTLPLVRPVRDPDAPQRAPSTD
jgi:MFS family permease